MIKYEHIHSLIFMNSSSEPRVFSGLWEEKRRTGMKKKLLALLLACAALSTAGGGSLFGEVGQIREGYRFNALVIDGLEDEGVKHTVSELLERFCYIGDDRNITRRFLDGREILL